MIVSKTVPMKCTETVKENLLLLGYPYHKGKYIEVKVEDLPPSSNIYIDVKCKYCNKDSSRMYHKVRRAMNEHPIYDYSCKECGHLRQKELAQYRLSNGELQEGDNIYWSFEENRLNALKEYIEEHGHVGLFLETHAGHAFKNRRLDLAEAIIKLGYDYDEVMGRAPNNYFDDFSNVEKRVNWFRDIFGYFPTKEEFLTVLKIGSTSLKRLGGVYGIKRKMNVEKENYKDASGFYNSSRYECFVANFLLANGISYKREQKPFSKPNHRKRSDFTFHLSNGEIVQCEIWGFPIDGKSDLALTYNQKRKEKEALYRSHNYRLISVEESFFRNNDTDSVQDILIDLFSPIFEIELKKIPGSSFLENASRK
jgi:hypothetical protein